MTQLTIPGTVKLYGANEAGCWFDGARGIYLGEAIIDTAIDHGFPIEKGGLAYGQRFSDYEWYHELWDEAEGFMQQFAAEGYYFGTPDWSSDWGLWAIEEEDN